MDDTTITDSTAFSSIDDDQVVPTSNTRYGSTSTAIESPTLHNKSTIVDNSVVHTDSKNLVSPLDVAAFETHSYQTVEMSSIRSPNITSIVRADITLTNSTADIDVCSSIGNSIITKADTAVITPIEDTSSAISTNGIVCGTSTGEHAVHSSVDKSIVHGLTNNIQVVPTGNDETVPNATTTSTSATKLSSKSTNNIDTRVWCFVQM
jgi:hypothetical protein